jgi:hypothetical protein
VVHVDKVGGHAPPSRERRPWLRGARHAAAVGIVLPDNISGDRYLPPALDAAGYIRRALAQRARKLSTVASSSTGGRPWGV